MTVISLLTKALTPENGCQSRFPPAYTRSSSSSPESRIHLWVRYIRTDRLIHRLYLYVWPSSTHIRVISISYRLDLRAYVLIGLNEHLVQWIGEESWAFQTKFSVSAAAHGLSHIDLVFEGLDTYATVLIDGKTVLECVGGRPCILGKILIRLFSKNRSNNMFVPYRVPLKNLGSSDCATEHSLVIEFNSTFIKGRALQRENADKTAIASRGGGATGGAGVMQGASNQIPGPNGELALWNGDASRLHVSPVSPGARFKLISPRYEKPNTPMVGTGD